ncbi:DUF262 domain-containing protein [Mycobacteroides abscessus]|uniref:DUF262 domain-containing protein n=1 Tax=Mycobacteroides abscessus TaxID=36809 RepID=UPI000C2661E2|nr:DUF262 domain-containing protein [Mycobacteroides abscessus]
MAELDDVDEPSESEPIEDIPLAERKLVTQAYDMSVNTLIEQWNDGTFILPDIQREYVWNNGKASRLIESLLLNVPIPVLYLAEAPDDHYEVIDGHQRIKSVARFINNEFRLSGLQVLGSGTHKGKKFHQLPAADQRRIKTRVIRAIMITDESHPTMKFEVFERLNVGATALTAQEIRNSTCRGNFMTRVRTDLVNDAAFRACIGTKKPRSRMVDEELIIRALAIRDRLDIYRPPLPRFLNKYSQDMNELDEPALNALSDVFLRAVGNAYAVFGANAFRLTRPDGSLVDRAINRGLAEAQLVTFSFANPDEIVRNRENLIATLGLLHQDAQFLDYIQRAIVDRSRTTGRMEAYRTACVEAGLALTSE